MTASFLLPKKLIEVALPLDAINAASAREKSIRHGHPSKLHLWWARRPLATARAVIFAQLVNDPASLWEFQNPGKQPTPRQRSTFTKRRLKLFDLITEMVQWKNTNNPKILEEARAEIQKSWREVCHLNQAHLEAASLFDPEKLPGLHDPFAGGGTIPLEAQRLGLEAFASELNPVAVLINKAMIEIPPKFAGMPPVHPELRQQAGMNTCSGAQGLAADVRAYGAWMREQALGQIGHLYPKVKITEQMAANRPDLNGLVDRKLTVIAWLWARTVKSPSPAFAHMEVPLVSSFVLTNKKGKEVWISPIVEGDTYHFEVQRGIPPKHAKAGTKSGRGANFECLLSRVAIEPEHIYSEAKAGRMGKRLLAIVAEGNRTRVYLDPIPAMEGIAEKEMPTWKPEISMPNNPRWFSPPLYGLKTYGDIFTNRQLVSLNSFCTLIERASDLARQNALSSGFQDDNRGIDEGGTGAKAYGESVGVYLAFAVSRAADRGSTLCSWSSSPKMETFRNTFGRQAIPMIWDFAEGNPFSDSSGNWTSNIDWVAKAMTELPSTGRGLSIQADAQNQTLSNNRFVSMDPPYYDNIEYADLSDFFYVWLRRILRPYFSSLFATMGVPKDGELVATVHRHGSKRKAEAYFLNGMTEVMRQLVIESHPGSPVTIYYAFKQAETNSSLGTASTGWVTFLEAVMGAGFTITGTWPMRTERSARTIGIGTNALASSIVLVCRRRAENAPSITRRDFIRELNEKLPGALEDMTKGAGDDQAAVAPVDLSQAIIGPGMAVFSNYSAVLEADGTPMTVKTALQLINQFLAESDFDADTQFCLHWFEQNGWMAESFGIADVLARAKATSLDGLAQAGVIKSGGGKVSLLKWTEYPEDWVPAKDQRLPIWEALHQIIRSLQQGGESSASRVLALILLKWTEYPEDWDPAKDQRLPIWEALHQIIRSLQQGDESHALAVIQSKADKIRQLAYRIYTLCERRSWAEDARSYNELVTAWSSIETRLTPRHKVPKSD